MSKRDWQRARSSKQIEERVDEILEGAAGVFLTVPYEKVTMQMIAGKAGFTRSNLYRYFNTREEIFLALFIRDVNTWAGEFSEAFYDETRPAESLETFAARWTEILCRQNRLLRLTPLLTMTLENNTSEEVYRRTKLAIRDKTAEMIPKIQNLIPALSSDQIFDFLLFHQALLAGGWPMTQYTDMQLKVLHEIGMQQLNIKFSVFYKRSILTYLRGVINCTQQI